MTRRASAAAVAALAIAAPGALATTTPATITTVAGTGAKGHTGDGGPAVAAEIDHPRGLAVLPDGGFIFAEPFANDVRRVAPDGTIRTLAGTGTAGFAGDGGPATAAQLDFVHGIARMPDGGFALADTRNERIRRVWPDGSITTIAGTGVRGFSGDGGPATAAAIDEPRGVAVFADGRILIPDTGNDRIRLVRRNGTIVTVAGNGVGGFAGDGGPATSAELSQPFGVAAMPDGGFLVADTGNNRIRRVAPDGTITTVAGDGAAGSGGDGGRATRAELDDVHNVVILEGGFVIADVGNDRVRMVDRRGTITTVAGTGTTGFAGDGGPATAAELNQPKAVAVVPDGRLLIADSANNRVRIVDTRLPVHSLRLALSRGVYHAKAGRHLVLRYTLNAPGTVRLDVVQHRRRRASMRGSATAGRNTIALRALLSPGSYALRLVATDLAGEVARSAARLVVTG